MGGLLAARLSQERPDFFTGGLMFIAPWFETHATYNDIVTRNLIKTFGRLQPQYLLPESLGTTEEEIEFNTHLRVANPERLKRYQINYFVEGFDQQYFLRNELDRIKVPSITVLGSEDDCVCNETIFELLGKMKSMDKVVKVYEDADHSFYWLDGLF